MFEMHDTTFLRYVANVRQEERRRAAAEDRLIRRHARRRPDR